MKAKNCLAALCAALIVNQASASDLSGLPFQSVDHSPRYMLYFHTGVGGSHRQFTRPAFGLSIERDVGYSLGATSNSLVQPSMRVFDLRLSSFKRSGIQLNGMRLGSGGSYGDDKEDNGSYDDEYFDNPWMWVFIGAGAAAAAACLTHNIICKRSDNTPTYDGGYVVPR